MTTLCECHLLYGGSIISTEGTSDATLVTRPDNTPGERDDIFYWYSFANSTPLVDGERALGSLKPLGTSGEYTGLELTFGARLQEYNEQHADHVSSESLVRTAIMRVSRSNSPMEDAFRLGLGLRDVLEAQVLGFFSALSAQGLSPYFSSVVIAGGSQDAGSGSAIAEGTLPSLIRVIDMIRSLPWFVGAKIVLVAPHSYIAESAALPDMRRVRQATFSAGSARGVDVVDGDFFDLAHTGGVMLRLNGKGYHDLGRHVADVVKGWGMDRALPSSRRRLGGGFKVWSDLYAFGGVTEFTLAIGDRRDGGFYSVHDVREQEPVVRRAGRGRHVSVASPIDPIYSINTITGDKLLRFVEGESELEAVVTIPASGSTPEVKVDWRPDRPGIWPVGIGPVTSPHDVCFFDGPTFASDGDNYRSEIVNAPELRSWVRADLCTTMAQKRGTAISSTIPDLAYQHVGKYNEQFSEWTVLGSPTVERAKKMNDEWAFVFSGAGRYFRTPLANRPSGGMNGFHVFVAAYPLASIAGRYIIGSRNNVAVATANTCMLRGVLDGGSNVVRSHIANGAGSDSTAFNRRPVVADESVMIFESLFSQSYYQHTIPFVNGWTAFGSAGDFARGGVPDARSTSAQWFVGGTTTNNLTADIFHGYIAEWIIYEGHLSWRQRMGVLAYLWERYGAYVEERAD